MGTTTFFTGLITVIDYTIPRNKWELQQPFSLQFGLSIIPYQEINGNYNYQTKKLPQVFIIPYQEINGNYNGSVVISRLPIIIPYQEINGNYNKPERISRGGIIIPYQEINGNYNLRRFQNMQHTQFFIASLAPFHFRLNSFSDTKISMSPNR